MGISPSLPPALPCFVLSDQGKEWQSWHRGQGAPPSVLAPSQRRECPHFPGPPLLQDGRMGWHHLGTLGISSAEICSLLSSITRISSGYFIYFVINSVYFIHPANVSARFFPLKKKKKIPRTDVEVPISTSGRFWLFLTKSCVSLAKRRGVCDVTRLQGAFVLLCGSATQTQSSTSDTNPIFPSFFFFHLRTSRLKVGGAWVW